MLIKYKYYNRWPTDGATWEYFMINTLGVFTIVGNNYNHKNLICVSLIPVEETERGTKNFKKCNKNLRRAKI